MDKRVAILGVGMHKFGRFPEKRPADMGREAALMALKDAGMDYRDIECGFCAHVQQPVGTGIDTFSELGMTGIPITNIEVACDSSTRSVELAAELICAGVYETALVIGVEKMPRGPIDLSLGSGTERSYNDLMGMQIPPTIYALRATRHMHMYGTKPEHFAKVSVKSHKNGCLNPYAQYQKEMTLEEVLNSRMIAYPIHLYECSPTTDGAAAVVITSLKKAKQYTSKPVTLIGWNSSSTIPPHEEDSPGILTTIEEPDVAFTAPKAYERAGVGPQDIDVAQVHDAFAPGEIFIIEELGFCPKGEGGPFVWEGNTEITGKIPVNTDGGLLSRGHPIGATGGAMIAELTWQLRGQAGARQIKNAKVALQENAGVGGMNVMIYTI